MPELPEVQTIVNELNKKLKNKAIKSVFVNAPKMVQIGPDVVSNVRKVKNGQVKKFSDLLIGKKILSVKRRAKLLIFDLSPTSPQPSHKASAGNARLRRTSGSLSILAHLKMTGQFIFEDKKLRQKTGGKYRLINSSNAPLVQLPSKHTHVIFKFTDGSTLYFNDVRKFGYLKLVRDNEIDQVRELSEYGPEPLNKEFIWGRFFTAVKKRPKGKIKQVLMDPKVVAGIGNIYSDEILFHAKVRPDRKVSSIKNQELRGIYQNIQKVLKQAIKAKGSSVGDFIRTDGSWGQMGKFHFVYGRAGEKCKVCGTVIQSMKIGGRTGSFCPKCQK